MASKERHYYCRVGAHRVWKNSLVVTYDDGHAGICEECIRKRTRGRGLKYYWMDSVSQSDTSIAEVKH